MHSSRGQPVFCAKGNLPTLELPNGSKGMEYQLARSGGCIGPLLQADQNDLSAIEVLDGFKKRAMVLNLVIAAINSGIRSTWTRPPAISRRQEQRTIRPSCRSRHRSYLFKLSLNLFYLYLNSFRLLRPAFLCNVSRGRERETSSFPILSDAREV